MRRSLKPSSAIRQRLDLPPQGRGAASPLVAVLKEAAAAAAAGPLTGSQHRSWSPSLAWVTPPPHTNRWRQVMAAALAAAVALTWRWFRGWAAPGLLLPDAPLPAPRPPQWSMASLLGSCRCRSRALVAGRCTDGPAACWRPWATAAAGRRCCLNWPLAGAASG